MEKLIFLTLVTLLLVGCRGYTKNQSQPVAEKSEEVEELGLLPEVDTSDWQLFDQQKNGVRFGVLPDFKFPKNWYTYNFAGGTRVGVFFSDGGTFLIQDLSESEITNNLFFTEAGKEKRENKNECKFSVSYNGSDNSYTTVKLNTKEDVILKKECEATIALLEEQVVGLRSRERKNNIFALSNIRPGNKIAGVEVVSINAFNQLNYQEVPPMELADNNATIRFRGEIVLSGNYSYAGPGDGIVYDEYCFNNLNEASTEKIPTLNTDNRHIWFCFTNKGKADELLGKENGEATIVIDNYVINSYPSEVWNTAELVKVINKD